MKSLLVANMFLYCLALSSAATFMGRFNDTDYPGKCFIKKYDYILSPGDIVQFPTGCGRLLCYNNGIVVGHTCGLIGPPSGCKLGERIKPDAPYPDCCSKHFICNNVESKE